MLPVVMVILTTAISRSMVQFLLMEIPIRPGIPLVARWIWIMGKFGGPKMGLGRLRVIPGPEPTQPRPELLAHFSR